MAAPTILGANAFTEQAKKRRFANGTGWVTVRTWKGPNTDSLVRQQEDLIRTYGAVSIETDTSIPCTISGTFPDAGGVTVGNQDQNSENNAVWELKKFEVDKKLASHPKWNTGDAAALKIAARLISEIDEAIRHRSCDPAMYSPPYCDYATLRILGTESYERYTYILTKSYSLAYATATKLDFANTMKCVTYQQIGVPQTVKWTEPMFIDFIGGSDFTLMPLQWLELPQDETWNQQTKKTDVIRTWKGAVSFSATLYNGGTGIP